MIDTKVFEARPGSTVLLLPDVPKFTIVAASNDFVYATGIKRENLIGRGFFEMFAASPAAHDTAEQNLRISFQYTLENKLPHQLAQQRFDFPSTNSSTFTEKYWKASNVPVLDEAGEIINIIHTLEDVTSLVKAVENEALLQGIEKSYNLFMNAPVIIGILKGDDYVIELANDDLLEVWGRTADVIGKPLLKAIPELEEQGFIALLDRVRATGEPFYAYEFPITLNRRGKDEVLYFDFVYKAIYDKEDDKIASAIISVGHDVTPQVVARRKVQESEAKYRNLFESMDQGFCVLEMIFDTNGKPVDYRFLETNPVFEQQTGLYNAVGRTALELVPNLEAHWLELYGNVVLTGEASRFVEGSEAMGRWFEVYAFRMGVESSRKVALLFTDVSERRKSEEALKQSERNLRNIILQAPVAMSILKGPTFIVEIANDKMFELWGRGKEELLGKSIFEGLPEVRDQGYEELLNGVYTTGKTFSALGTPVTLPRNEKIETVYINLLYEAFRDADGTISGIMAVAIDVTEQVLARQKIEEVVAERTKELAQSNEALVRSNQELARSNQNLEEFAYAASHDLKEPVRKIHFFSGLLRDELVGTLNEKQTRYFGRMEHAAKRMGNLIDDLLMYSHVSKGVSLVEEVDLNGKLKLVLEDLELEIAEKQAKITVGSLPVIKGHRRQLQQLFQNLIGNALKYSKPDVAPEVAVTARIVKGNEVLENLNGTDADRSFHLIEVQDNGIGFDQQDAERIFNVFTRLHGSAEYRGTGVGLSIARKVVENHRGHIWANSQPGLGSTFHILFPAET